MATEEIDSHRLEAAERQDRQEAEPPVPPVLGSRYRVDRELKRGPSVRTLLATDLETERPVVVKATPSESLSPVARMRLGHEAETLARLRDPSVAPLLGMGREARWIYLVMPYIEGQTLEERLAAGPLEVADAITVGRRVLAALDATHVLGILHRDVKPANVIVDAGSPLSRVTLIDFGLARSVLLDREVRHETVGTARYISPEQAGLLDLEVDARSDLYSAGVVLFECLAGHPPFRAETIGELLRLHLTAPPPELRGLGLAVPRALDEVIGRLLAKDPRDRYQSAAAAVADLEAIEAARARGVAEPALVVGMRDARQTLTEPAFVGRAQELEALSAEVRRTTLGEGRLVRIEAESGGGKTRVLDELAQRALRDGVWVLRGGGVDQAAPKPFQLLEGIGDEIAAVARRDEEVAGDLARRLGEHRQAVGAALPQLTEALGAAADDDEGPELFGENRSLEGLSALLESLGSAERPALVLLDDCQWGDELTFKLLRRWQERAADAPPGGRHVTIVTGFRSEEVPADHLLRRLRGPSLRLPDFGDSDLRKLAESMAGDLPDEALEAVVERAEGNPFMASAVLRGLVECGALIDGPAGWELDSEALAEAQSSRQAAAVLTRRLELLPAEATELLAAGAVLGKDFDLGLAAALADQTRQEALSAFEEARERHMVWASEDRTCGAFVHDKLREALLAHLGAERRRRLHGKAATQLEHGDRGGVFELAYHFDAAGEPERALPYALRAAREARQRHALEVAEEQYRIAQRGGGDADAASRLQIAEGLGDVLMMRGRYDEAQQQLSRALPLAEGEVARAQLQGKVGELAFKRGDVASASRSTEEALRLLGRRVPRRGTWLPSMLLQAVIQVLHTLLPRVFVGRRSLERAEPDLLAARLLSSLAHSYWFERGKVPTLWTHLLGMNLAERYPPTPELGQAYSEHAPVMTMLPWLSRGIRYAQRSLAIRRSLGDPWGEGRSLHFYGIVLYCASDYERSIERCKEAIRLLERTGDRWEINTARWHVAFCLYRLGRLDEAVETAKHVHRDGLEIGDAQATGISLGAWSKASGGRVPAEATSRELERPSGDVHTAAEVRQAEAIRLLAAGRPSDAVARLEEAHRLVTQKGLKQEYVAPILPWLATALREHAEGLPTQAEWKRRRLLRRARKAARRGRRQARSFKNNLPHSLRELGLAEAALGHSSRARRLLDQSVESARAQGAQFELGQSLLARGRLGRELGWDSAAADLGQAEERLADTRLRPALPSAGAATGPAEQPVTLALADRFNTLLDGGRQIASALSRTDIFAAVREAGVSLLRGERCLVLEVPEGGGPEDVRSVSDELGGGLDPHCRAMAVEALERGGPVVHSASSRPEDSTSEELELSGVRSALCAPIFVRNRAVGCFYVSHRGIAGLFGEDDMRLAAFVATLAGAALENSEGFSAVQELTRSLEKRVQDRTAELEETNRRLDLSLSKLRDAYDRERGTAQQLKHQAFHDSLTDLANRGLLADRVEHALARAKRLKSTLAVLFLDLDDFKTINDSLGHTVGDELLVAVAARLRECLRESDTAARLGGDEFAILIEDVSEPADVARTAERLIDSLETPFILEGKEVFVHASIGVALGHGGRDETSGDLLRNADLAMYIAKGQGKRRYEFFRPSMHSGVIERLELKADLQRALEHQEFVLHYQPIVRLETSEIIGMEALVRWQHPERGLLPPGDFIPLAEETGLIRPLGEWVLREACTQMRAWQAMLGRELTITVNLSPRQVSEPTLVQEVAAALMESALPPESLVLEITETVLMRDTETTTGKLGRLKRLGVRLAIDDFGTGYSSLDYLKRLPIDMIKVAKPFVDDVTKGSEQSALAQAIIRLGDTFGLETVAEGIEAAGQAERLRELGCPLGQGFFFSMPLRVPEAEVLLEVECRASG